MTPEQILKRYDALKAKRQAFWDPLWEVCASYMLPRKSGIMSDKTPGVEGYTQNLYDVTAEQANNIMAAGIITNAAPASERWFAYEPSPVLIRTRGRSHNADTWFQECTDIIHRELANSNFYDEAHEALLERGLGTCCLSLEQGRENLFLFDAISLGSYVIAENDEGKVRTLFREFPLTVEQAAEKWGVENLPPKLVGQYNSGNMSDRDCPYQFVHAVFPRPANERKPGARTGRNKPFASVYICREGPHKVSESGYDEFPYAVGRFLTWPDEVYGFGPAVSVLPVTRQVNFIERQMDALAETKAFPRVLVPHNLQGAVDLRPAGVTTFDANQMNGVPQEWGTEGEYNVGKERVEAKQEFIRRAFHNELFAMLQGIEPGKATWGELQARLRERLQLFAPTFNRVTGELFSPLLMRAFGIAFRAGWLPDPPPEVFVPTAAGVALALPQVSYTSQMAIALRQLQSQASINTIQTVAPVVEVKPDILDVYDLDAWAVDVARNNGMNPALIRPPQVVAQLREARAQQQAAMQQAEMAQMAARAGADAAKATPRVRDAFERAIDV